MSEKKKFYKTFKALILKISLLTLIIFIVFNYVIGIKSMKGVSMFPKILDGDLIIYSRLDETYNINDVIVYESDGIEKVGRVIAKEGDSVDFTTDGELKVNGNVQNEEIFFETFATSKDITFPYHVNESSCFVLSDNRIQGVDSRVTGDIQQKNIKGKVIVILRIRGF